MFMETIRMLRRQIRGTNRILFAESPRFFDGDEPEKIPLLCRQISLPQRCFPEAICMDACYLLLIKKQMQRNFFLVGFALDGFRT
jgi:hypothetical protein